MLSTPVNQLAGIGPAAEKSLAKIGIHTLLDLVLHLPLRYEDRTQLTDITQCHLGQWAQFEGTVSRTYVLPTRRPIHVIELQIDQHSLALKFLNYQQWTHTLPQVGKAIRVYGQLKQDMHQQWEMLHPQITRLDRHHETHLPTHLTAVYPSIGAIKQHQWRRAIADALARLQQQPIEALLPNQPLTFLQALNQIHLAQPGDAMALMSGTHPAVQHLALEELTAYQLLARHTRQAQVHHHAPALITRTPQIETLLKQLPFTPTADQQTAWQQIQHDLQQPHPMHRLLQGDVGSGKTLLAALAAAHTAAAGYQCALMAPTEILAEQLYQSLAAWLTPLGISCQRLSARSKAAEKRQTLLAIADGHIQVIIGTHTLFQTQVHYHRLGLVIVDEQHRFGVEQRLALKHKGQHGTHTTPHLLLMTATPIPRTLTMSLYGDLSLSTLYERPPGRQPIDTHVMPDNRREALADRLANQCQQGAQAYWVCPFVHESDSIEAHNATQTASWLKARHPALRVALIHGQMNNDDKDNTMRAFQAGHIDVLVATTVIEVGVNVPNASLIIIDNSERYGLAQLHQLRGRVGRGTLKSHCVLLYHAPLSNHAHARLNAIRHTQDGFALAELDLQLRGPGELLGTRQTGLSRWRIADLVRDAHLHARAQALAQQIEQQATAREALIQRWFNQQLSLTTV